MRIYYIIILICFLTHPDKGQAQAVQTFPLKDVDLLQSPFSAAQLTDKQYILELDADRLLAPFMIEAGLEPLAPRYGNWENTGLDGHIGGHYLSALAFMYAATGDEQTLERLEYMLDILAHCQEKNGNGYVGGIPGGQAMWNEIAAGNIRAHNFSLNDKWVPLYNIHKLYAGLRDAWLVAEIEKAKEIWIDLGDWMVELMSGLTDSQIQQMLVSEHGGLNEVFADLAEVTGENKYLDLAVKLSHHQILNPLVAEKDMLAGLHANTQIPKVIGFKRIAELNDNANWHDASAFFWETVVENRTVSIGGNSVEEHFQQLYDWSTTMQSSQGPETCNTYNMLRLTQKLFLSDPDVRYIDFYERALYNHILSSQHPEGGFVYFTPMRPRHYRTYSEIHESFWCCVGSGIENHGKYGELIYAHTNDALFINLFIPSSLAWTGKGISVEQSTGFPYEDTVRITINAASSTDFTLKIRQPSWVSEGMAVYINGTAYDFQPQPASYLSIHRTWNDADKIEVILPMETRLEYLPGSRDWASFVHGPVVLAAVTDSTGIDGLWAGGGRWAHIANGPLYHEEPAITVKSGSVSSDVRSIDPSGLSFSIAGLISDAKFKDLKLVPFYTIHEARYAIYWAVEHVLSVSEKDNARFNAFPNPSRSGVMTLNLSAYQGPEGNSLIIYDRLGKTVSRIKVGRGQQEIRINLPPGMYVAKLGGVKIGKKLLFY